MSSAIARAVRYLDQRDWEKAHALVQDDESMLGCWAHGIVHLLEGDVSNARYWYARAGRSFPARGDVSAEIEALVRAVQQP